MAKLVQCVPNFSEGKRPEVVEKIAGAIAGVPHIKLADFSWDVDHNRSVITFIGPLDMICDAMLAGARVAVDTIDLREHAGGHPRIGAIDVVPAVPLMECTMDECITLSHEIGKEFAENLGIPVYFYGKSARLTHRSALPNVRKGGFERLKNTLELTGDLKPDIGPLRVHPTAGATAVGARGPLVAFNVNLNTSDLGVAREIARKIREVRNTGILTGVRAIGVELKSRGIVQVSTNITEPQETSMYEVYSFVEIEAVKLGVDVLESELIGGLRRDAVIDAVKESMKLQSLTDEKILDNWF